jgi:hypothetical protein
MYPRKSVIGIAGDDVIDLPMACHSGDLAISAGELHEGRILVVQSGPDPDRPDMWWLRLANQDGHANTIVVTLFCVDAGEPSNASATQEQRP